MSMLSLSWERTKSTVDVQSARLGLAGASFSSAKKRETTLWARRCIRKLGFMHLLARLMQVRHLVQEKHDDIPMLHRFSFS